MTTTSMTMILTMMTRTRTTTDQSFSGIPSNKQKAAGIITIPAAFFFLMLYSVAWRGYRTTTIGTAPCGWPSMVTRQW